MTSKTYACSAAAEVVAGVMGRVVDEDVGALVARVQPARAATVRRHAAATVIRDMVFPQ
jgi:hypothetical protein